MKYSLFALSAALLVATASNGLVAQAWTMRSVRGIPGASLRWTTAWCALREFIQRSRGSNGWGLPVRKSEVAAEVVCLAGLAVSAIPALLLTVEERLETLRRLFLGLRQFS